MGLQIVRHDWATFTFTFKAAGSQQMEFFVFSNIQLPVTSLFPVLSEFNLDCKLENISNVSLFSEIPGTVKNTTLENWSLVF